MLHKWKTTGALAKHFSFTIPNAGKPAALFNNMYSSVPAFKQYTPVMAAAMYLVAYRVLFDDARLEQHLEVILPRLMAQGHLSPFQIEALESYNDEFSLRLQADNELLGVSVAGSQGLTFAQEAEVLDSFADAVSRELVNQGCREIAGEFLLDWRNARFNSAAGEMIAQAFSSDSMADPIVTASLYSFAEKGGYMIKGVERQGHSSPSTPPIKHQGSSTKRSSRPVSRDDAVTIYATGVSKAADQSRGSLIDKYASEQGDVGVSSTGSHGISERARSCASQLESNGYDIVEMFSEWVVIGPRGDEQRYTTIEELESFSSSIESSV